MKLILTHMNRFFLLLSAGCLLGSCSPKTRNAGQTTRYNLDFEYTELGLRAPLRWNVYAYGYDAVVDTVVRHRGDASLQVVRRDTTPDGCAFFNQILSADAAGREVCLTGWVRTEGVDEGMAGFWIGGDDTADWDFHDSASPSVKGTSDWTQLTVRAHLSDTARLLLAIALTGRGTAWFDDFEITIDGVPLVDSLVPAPKCELTRTEKRALRRYVHPLRTWESDGGDTKDLEPVGRLIGNASVVALGEVTHGSREIFQMKERLIRYLAEHEGFDIFSIEANMPESYAVGDYVAGGEGDAKTLIGGMYFWTWNTETMLDLTEWMRGWNASGHKMAYTGVDIQYYGVSLRILERAFAGDAVALRQVRELAKSLDAVREACGSYHYGHPDSQLLRDTGELLAQLETRIEAMPDEAAARCEVPAAGGSGREWLRQQVTLMRQYLSISSGPMGERYWNRDLSMAENLLWIKAQNPASRIVVWAHNDHVKKEEGSVGGHLYESLGDDYVTFGFAFYDGNYTAYSERKLTSCEAKTACPGTLEYLLNQLGEPVFLLDLKAMRDAHDPMLEWIEPLYFRSVGAGPTEPEFSDDNCVPAVFDYLLFIRHTTPSRLLSKK